MQNKNKYDNVVLNVNQLFSMFESSKSKEHQTRKTINSNSLLFFIKSITYRYITGLTYLFKIHKRLLYANIKLDWFFEFQKYWVSFLGNRPISVHDFHFLRNEYRKRFQDVALTGDSHEEHLNSWQDYRNIYSVFGAVWHTAFTDLISAKYTKYIKRHSLVCEFGCGIAPIAHSFLKFYPEKKLRFTIADIRQFTFHYAIWRLMGEKNVKKVIIDPSDRCPLPEDEWYDVIFICQVFEHLQNPLETAEYLHSRLKSGGILIFDYFKSDGTGLDTRAGVAYREKTMKFIKEHFRVLRGNPDPDENAGTIVVRKF